MHAIGNLPVKNDLPDELALGDLPHLSAPYGHSLCETTEFGLELPYASIGDRGFERLCFHLLLSQGRTPRFFGRRGQAQFGIDLIVSNGEQSDVYQCKNRQTYTAADLQSDLNVFAESWLVGKPDLMVPTKFVLCCAARLDDREKWEDTKQNFFLTHRVTIEEWHRDTLDKWLRREPDIVADLFGNDLAERFCHSAGWNDGLFRPLVPGSGEKDIERYLALRGAAGLVHDPIVVAKLHDALAGEGLVLIEGQSGNGKTMAAIDLAASFEGGIWRVFFISLRHELEEQQLFQGIRDRCIRPTLFILDDCHRNLPLVERTISRMRHATRGRAYGLILTAQTAAHDTEPLTALYVTSFVDECRTKDRAVTISPTIEQYREILVRARPSVAGISREGLERLYVMTAQDLAVLDILLESMEDRALLHPGVLPEVFPRILRRYFGREKVHAPSLKMVAAIAQFDLAVPMNLLPEPFERAENVNAAERLTIRTGSPAHSQPTSVTFVHASAAEIVFRALSWTDVDHDWMSAAATCIVHHLTSLQSIDAFNRDVGLFIRTRLRLGDASRIKFAVLTDHQVSARIRDQGDHAPLQVLSSATFLTQSLGQSSPYAEWLAKRLANISVADGGVSREELSLIGPALRSLALTDPKLHASTEVQLAGKPMLRLILAHGTIIELFRIILHSAPTFASGLINALDPPTVADFIEKTMTEGRSIGTLSLMLRELVERSMPEPDERGQLAVLEAHLGHAPMLQLIRANGTILDLFKVLECSTPSFAAGLIKAIDSAIMAEFIEKTIAEGRSIGTLHLALRKLAELNMPEPDERSQLAVLESHLAGAPMLRLIRANGTIFELFRVIQYGTPNFAAGLINALDPPALKELIDKTIAERRSIATLDFTLRELAKRNMPKPDTRSQLEALEARLGGALMLRLIRANGTICELFNTIQRSTLQFAAELVNAINPCIIGELINKTIAEGRSIGTLNFALRKLHKTDPTSQATLEHALGIDGFWRLVEGAGDLNDLAYLLSDLTLNFRQRLLAPNNAPNTGAWAKLVRRGGFYAIVRFVRDGMEHFPIETGIRLEAAVSEVLPDVVARSSWPDLSTGFATLEKVPPTQLRVTLETAALARIDCEDINKLSFESFIDAANGLRCFWYHRETLRSEIGPRLWTFLPPRRYWPEDYSLFLGGRFLLQIGISEHVTQPDAEQLIQAFSMLPRETEVEKASASVLYLFVWNLFALWVARGTSIAKQFAGVQSDEFWSRVEEVVTIQTAKSRRNDEKLNVLALAGLMTLLFPARTRQLAEAVRGRIRGVSWLVKDADKLTFVPALLACKGLSLIAPHYAIFSVERRSRLLVRAADYEEGGPAIDLLCKWLRQEDRYPRPLDQTVLDRRI